jgi:hypothetical protein
MRPRRTRPTKSPYSLRNQTAERNRFDTLLNPELAVVPDGPPEDAGVALGKYVAAQMLAWRANDGSSASVPYTIGHYPGDWQPTPPAFALRGPLALLNPVPLRKIRVGFDVNDSRPDSCGRDDLFRLVQADIG